jgi:hypothetical protein
MFGGTTSYSERAKYIRILKDALIIVAFEVAQRTLGSYETS